MIDIDALKRDKRPQSSAIVHALLDRLEAAEADALEQARLNGMGSEREAALMAKLEAAEKSDAESLAMYRKARDERDTYKAAYNDCIDKTEWVQEEINRGDLPAKYLGMHRADVIRAEIMRLRDKIEAMERQAPVGEIRDANELGIAQYADIWPCLKAKDKLYALLGAKPPPSVPKGWIQRGMAELEAIRSRQDDDTLLDDRTLIERIGKAMLAAAQEAKP